MVRRQPGKRGNQIYTTYVQLASACRGSGAPWRSGSRANRASMLLRMSPSPPELDEEKEGRFFLAWQATRDGEWVVREWEFEG